MEFDRQKFATPADRPAECLPTQPERTDGLLEASKMGKRGRGRGKCAIRKVMEKEEEEEGRLGKGRRTDGRKSPLWCGRRAGRNVGFLSRVQKVSYLFYIIEL